MNLISPVEGKPLLEIAWYIIGSISVVLLLSGDGYGDNKK